MNKISSIIRSQAHSEFRQKRKEIIKNTLDKHKDKTNFQEILELYI